MMLVHICCSVDSNYFLKRLREKKPDERLVGFFYNPNIHPYEEYRLRLLDVRRSCDKYGILLIEGEYDLADWLQDVKGREGEKERGARCEICFESRLLATAKKAKELGENSITTTLFMSPKKSMEQLRIASENIALRENIEVLCFDFRKNGGTNEQFKLARDERLYRQNYCGCIYALKDQREAQKRFADELVSPIGGEILPCSIKERLELYKKVYECEKSGKEYRIDKEKFQNWRFLWGRVWEGGKVIPSIFLFDFDIEGNKIVEVTALKSGFGFTKNDEILFIDLAAFNKAANSNFKSVKEMIFRGVEYEKQIELYCSLIDCDNIIVLDEVKKTTYKIEANTIIYQDVREVLAIL